MSETDTWGSQFYTARLGWQVAPHGVGTYQECLFPDVLASRDGDDAYTLFVHNIRSRSGRFRFLPRDVKRITLQSKDDAPTDHELVRRIMRRYGARACTLFVDFDEMPALEIAACAGVDGDGLHENTQEGACTNTARFWAVPYIDGYTSARITVCEAHAKYWSNQFDDCPFVLPPQPITFAH